MVAIAVRGKSSQVIMHRLPEHLSEPGETTREKRQWAATEFVLAHIAEVLKIELLN